MEFFFIITLLYPAYSGMAYFTRKGTVTAKPGETRQDLFNKILASVHSSVDEPGIRQANVVFFSLEANELLVTV
ncbi:hypothetical protein ACFOY4_10160 [Actinomadura syzygii]|uniref:Uncharacterized protein n=1 Tax=Actinomadura syzygii TaxID=1427538 RepID=A0A5D0UCM0_9ACTN|nr:hypothetical protein [Actinomadura syzygii]TYC15827.1 hypothetical protein FXF65_10810 [Actinomadura syzygii]